MFTSVYYKSATCRNPKPEIKNRTWSRNPKKREYLTNELLLYMLLITMKYVCLQITTIIYYYLFYCYVGIGVDVYVLLYDIMLLYMYN